MFAYLGETERAVTYFESLKISYYNYFEFLCYHLKLYSFNFLPLLLKVDSKYLLEISSYLSNTVSSRFTFGCKNKSWILLKNASSKIAKGVEILKLN